jgi:hypothetical protein
MSESTHDLPNERRPRRWRWLKLTGLTTLAIVGLGLIWFAVANWRASTRLNAKLAEVEARGVPLSLVELSRTPPPPDQNAATYLDRAAAQLNAIEGIMSTAEEQLSYADQYRFQLQRMPPPALLAALHQAFAENAEAIPLLFKAAAAPDYDPQLNYDQPQHAFLEEYLNNSQEVRRPIRVLSYYVTMCLNDGKQAEALDACIAMFQLIRHFDRRPLLTGFLVNLAVRGVAVHAANSVLRAGPLPPEGRSRLEAELAHPVPRLQSAIESERAYGMGEFRELPIAGSAYLRTPMGKRDMADYLELLDGIEKRAQSPYSEVHAWIDSLQLGTLAQLMVPAVQASYEAETRLTAQLRCLQILNVLTQRVSDNPDSSANLTDLGLPADATTDPYNGKPLIVRHEPNGWLIYSVGQNGQDDGGRIHDSAPGGYLDVGLGPPVAPSVGSSSS